MTPTNRSEKHANIKSQIIVWLARACLALGTFAVSNAYREILEAKASIESRLGVLDEFTQNGDQRLRQIEATVPVVRDELKRLSGQVDGVNSKLDRILINLIRNNQDAKN